MYKKSIIFSFLLIACSVSAMEPLPYGSSSSSSSSSSSNYSGDRPDITSEEFLTHPLANTHYFFTLFPRFSELKQRAPQFIAKLITHYQSQDGNFGIVSASHDGKYFAATSGPAMRIVDSQSGEIIRAFSFDNPQGPYLNSISYSLSDKRIESVTFSPDGNYLAVVFHRGAVDIVDAQTGSLIRTLLQASQEDCFTIYSTSFSADGNFFAAGCGSVKTKIWDVRVFDVQTGELICTVPHPNIVDSISFIPQKDLCITGCRDYKACIFDVQTGTMIGRQYNNSHWVNSVASSPDGIIWATGSLNEVTLCEGSEVSTLLHPHRVDRVAFSPDGIHLATGCWDGKIRIFDWHTREKIYTLPSRDKHGMHRSVAFSTDGTILSAIGYDGSAARCDFAHMKTIEGSMTAAQCDLLQAFEIAIDDRARIHANEEQWEVWQSLQKILRDYSVKRLARYIIPDEIAAKSIAFKKIKRDAENEDFGVMNVLSCTVQ